MTGRRVRRLLGAAAALGLVSATLVAASGPATADQAYGSGGFTFTISGDPVYLHSVNPAVPCTNDPMDSDAAELSGDLSASFTYPIGTTAVYLALGNGYAIFDSVDSSSTSTTIDDIPAVGGGGGSSGFTCADGSSGGTKTLNVLATTFTDAGADTPYTTGGFPVTDVD